MSNGTTEASSPNQVITPRSNIQNGVRLPFNPAKILKGPNNGKPTLKPDFKHLNVEEGAPDVTITPELFNLIRYVGVNESYSMLTGKINTLAVNVFNAAKIKDDTGEETGEVDLDLWQQLIAGATIAGETMSDLEDKLDDLSEQFEALTMSEANSPEEFAALKVKLAGLREEKAKIREALASRQEQAALVAKKRAATRERNEAVKAEAAVKAGGSAVSAPALA